MPVSRSTVEETNFVPGQAVFELTMHQCIEAGQAFDLPVVSEPRLASALRRLVSEPWAPPSPSSSPSSLPLRSPRTCFA